MHQHHLLDVTVLAVISDFLFQLYNKYNCSDVNSTGAFSMPRALVLRPPEYWRRKTKKTHEG